MKKKVIAVSNFGDEMVNDVHIVGGLSETAAKEVAKILNSELSGPMATMYYTVADNDKVLYKFEH